MILISQLFFKHFLTTPQRSSSSCNDGCHLLNSYCINCSKFAKRINLGPVYRLQGSREACVESPIYTSAGLFQLQPVPLSLQEGIGIPPRRSSRRLYGSQWNVGHTHSHDRPWLASGIWHSQPRHYVIVSGVFRGGLVRGSPFGRTAVIFVTILGLFLAPFRDIIAATSDQMRFFGRKML